MMDMIAEFGLIAKNLERESITFKEHMNSLKRVTDEDVVDGVDRLIYNHALKKGELARLLGFSKNTQLDTFIQSLNFDVSYFKQGQSHCYDRFTVSQLLDARSIPRYGDQYDSMVWGVANQKGGTGKTTTTLSLAVAIALDLSLNARVVVLDADMQGSGGQSLILSHSDDSQIYVTLADLILYKYEPDGLVSKLINENGMSFEDVVLESAFGTHLPNMMAYPAFPDDDRLAEVYSELNDEEKDTLISTLRNEIVPILKKKFDFILIDTPPQDSPITWTCIEACDGLLIPVTPSKLDMLSTKNFIQSLHNKGPQYPSKLTNLKCSKFVNVNVDTTSVNATDMIQQLLAAAPYYTLTNFIERNEFYQEASNRDRTILDIMKSESSCSLKKVDSALMSLNSVYKEFIRESQRVSRKLKQ
jgi:chromosome partitioning protein